MPIVPVCAPGEDRRYDIHIEPGLLARCAPLLTPYAGRRAVIVADSNTAPLYGDTLLAQLKEAGVTAALFTLPAGEQTKCQTQLFALYDAFLDARLTRSDLVIALGGGVIGDITGFAACTYLRGVRFIQVPTTLLAQVDSSVGGKVAINHERGKNLLGAFYQPELVIIDPDTLKTLDERQIGAGLGEVIKYGLIADGALFEMIERAGCRERLLPEFGGVIARCCAIKARYVAEDPLDHGVRMQLNFGHTLAHALENGLGYGTLLHGEAVCIGMVAACRWGEALGITPPGTESRLRALLSRYALPTERPQGLTREALAASMALDKKACGKTVNAVILETVGRCRCVPLTAQQLSGMI